MTLRRHPHLIYIYTDNHSRGVEGEEIYPYRDHQRSVCTSIQIDGEDHMSNIVA